MSAELANAPTSDVRLPVRGTEPCAHVLAASALDHQMEGSETLLGRNDPTKANPARAGRLIGRGTARPPRTLLLLTLSGLLCGFGFPGRRLLEEYAAFEDLGQPIVLQNSIIKFLGGAKGTVPTELAGIINKIVAAGE